MKKSRYTEAQIIVILRQAEGGVPVAQLCRFEHANDLLKEALGKTDQAISAPRDGQNGSGATQGQHCICVSCVWCQ